MTLNNVEGAFILVAWFGGIGLYIRYALNKIKTANETGVISSGGMPVERVNNPLKFKFAVTIFKFGVAGMSVLFLGGILGVMGVVVNVLEGIK